MLPHALGHNIQSIPFISVPQSGKIMLICAVVRHKEIQTRHVCFCGECNSEHTFVLFLLFVITCLLQQMPDLKYFINQWSILSKQ